ncbi:hypothetical protein C0J52_06468 [Blattella germanica]|nr:hypothetical protein C0J52_06468 [Blattella germanica]
MSVCIGLFTSEKDDTSSGSRNVNKNETPLSPLSSRIQKAEYVKHQRQKRLKEQVEEKRKKRNEMDEKKRRLAELREKQLKIVKNNVKKARLKSNIQKKDIPESIVEDAQFLNLVPQLMNAITSEESKEQTQEKKDSLIIRLDDVISCKRKEEEEEFEKTVSNKQDEMKKSNIFLDNKDIPNVRKLHANITQRLRAQQTSAPEIVPLNDNMRSDLQLTERNDSKFDSIKDLDENLQTTGKNNVSFPEDPLEQKLKKTLEGINLLRNSENYKELISPHAVFKRHNNEIVDYVPSKRQNNKIEKHIPFKRQNNNIENRENFNESKTVQENMENIKKQEAAAIKIQTAFRRYKSRMLKKAKNCGIEKSIFTRSEKRPEIKRSSSLQVNKTKKQADKNWKAAKYPSFLELRTESGTSSDWLQPMFAQPCGYNMMTAIQNTILSRSKPRQPYWLQANRENINRLSDMKNEPGQTVPILDASKQKARKAMTVHQYIRSSKLSTEDLQSFLTSDEESRSDDLTSSGADTDRSRRLRKQINFKLQKVLPDRVKHGNLTQSDTHLLRKQQPLKCRKKLIEHSGKENIEVNIRPSTAIEMTCASPKKIKQMNYDLVAPNVELKRRNVRYKNMPTTGVETKGISDSDTWNSHLTFQQLIELRKEERSKGIPLDLSSHVNDPNTWESHVTQRQKVSQEHFVGEPLMKTVLGSSDKNQSTGVHLTHKKHYDHNLPVSSEEGDVGYSGKRNRTETESDTSKIQETSPSTRTRKHRRNISHLLREELNRLESIEQSSKHLTALEEIFIKNMKMKQDDRRNLDNLEDKQIEVKPLTVDNCAQTIDLIVPDLMLATERKEKESTKQLNIHKPTMHKQTAAKSTEVCTQTELSDDKLIQNSNAVSESIFISHNELRGMNSNANLSKPELHTNRNDVTTTIPSEFQPLFQPGEESHTSTNFTARPGYQDCHSEIRLREEPSNLIHKSRTKLLNIPKLLQESEQTRKTVAHAMEMGAVERSVKRDDEKDQINRKHKLWSIEHMKRMNEIAREDNQLFEQSLFGRTSFKPTQAFVHSSLFLPRTIENQQTQNVNGARNEVAAAQDDAGRCFPETQSLLQQQHQERFGNINFSRGSDMPLKTLTRITDIEAVGTVCRNTEDRKNISVEPSNDVTSDFISEEDASVLKTEDRGFQDLDLSVSNFSDTSAISMERSNKITKLIDSIQKFDKLIADEKKSTHRQLVLLNERFVHMKERTKTEMKLIRVKIREYDNLRKATADRKMTLRQQKAMLQSYLKSIESKGISVQEEQMRKKELSDSHHQSRLSSVIDKEDSSFLTSEVEKSLQEVPKLESIQLTESAIGDQNNLLNEAKISPSVIVSPKQDTVMQQSQEFSDVFEDTEYSSQKDSASVVSGLEDRMKTITDLLQRKKSEVENMKKDKKKKKWKVMEHTMLNHIQTFQEYLDSLKRELENIMDSSTTDVTLQSEELEKEHGKHISESSDAISGKLFKSNISDSRKEIETNSNVTYKSKIPKRKKISDEYKIQTQLEEASLLQDGNITSGAISTVFSPHSIPTLDVSNEEILGDELEIPSEIEIMKSDTSVVHTEEKSGITTDMKETSKIDEDTEEKSQIATEIDEDIEDKSQMSTEIVDKSDLVALSEDGDDKDANPEEISKVTEILTVQVPDENIQTATVSEYSNIITEVPEKSRGNTEVEEEFELDTNEIETSINSMEKGALGNEDKSEISIQKSDISIEEEQYEMSTEDEEMSEVNSEGSKKSEIKTDVSDEYEVNTEADESKIETEVDEKNTEASKSDVFTDQGEHFYIPDNTEIKSDTEEEIQSEDDISNGDEASISIEAPAKGQSNSEIIYELNDIEEGLEATSEMESRKAETVFESETEKHEIEDVKEVLEIITDKESILSEELHEGRSEQEPSIDKQCRTKSEELVPTEFQSESAASFSKESSLVEPEENIEIEESAKEEFSSNIEPSEKIKSSYSESSIVNQKQSEGKIIMPDETVLLTDSNEVTTEHDRTEMEHEIEKSEDINTNVASNLIEVSNKTKDGYSSESDSVMKNKLKLLSEKTDKITDAILKKILYESFMPLHKIPIETISEHYSESDSPTIENDMNENEDDLVLNETSFNDREDNSNFVNELKKKKNRVDSITNVIFEELLRDSAKIAYKNKNNVIYSKVIEDSSTESSSSEKEESPPHKAVTGIKPASTSDFDVRKRVHEILAESNASLSSPREKTRPQDFMVTTYDVLSPEDTPSDTSLPGSPTKLDILTSTIPEGSDPGQKLLELQQSTGGEQGVSDVFSQEWFEDDFGLSTTRREAEELRLQQLQIEQEASDVLY